MSYIGAEPTTVAFLTDTFSGDGSTVAFTMSVAPATTSSILVAITGVVQDPSTYSVVGTTLTFSAAPPSGTGNISVRYLGIPASGVTTTAYRAVTEFTATAGQTTFSVPSYTVGYIDVYRNGVRLAAADYTATDGTTVVLASGATAGDSVVTESFYVSSVLNAIPATAGAVNSTYLADGSVTRGKMGYAGAILQVVTNTTVGGSSTTSTTYVDMTNATLSITPTSATSKILVTVSGTLFASLVGGTNVVAYAQLVRGSTSLQEQIGSVQSGAGGLQGYFPTSFCFLDSPATTSSVTYKLQQKVSTASSTLTSSSFYIVVQEVFA